MTKLSLLTGLFMAQQLLAADTQPAQTQPNPELTDEAIDARIRLHRTSEATLVLTDSAGRPLADAAVVIRQVRHKFLFGCNVFKLGRCGSPALNEAYARQFRELFNYATLGFYWGTYERQPGQLAADQLRRSAQWCLDNRIRPKGHPLVWHEVTPQWLAQLPPAEVAPRLLGRVTREVEAFRGLIDTWDVVNEAVVMPTKTEDPVGIACRDMGPLELIRQAFARARQGNPHATLLLNDFQHGQPFEQLLDECFQAGVPIDAIGLQSHMHKGAMGPETVWDVCQRFSRFGRPLHWTEVTLVSGELMQDDDWHSRRDGWNTTSEGEERQARQAAQFYRVLFSHPAVAAITWWDFSDQGAWLGAPAGLVRKDMTPKPAYDALHQLIRGQWWTGPLELKTNALGEVTFRGFLGEYVVESDTGAAGFSLDRPGAQRQSVRLLPREGEVGL